MKSKTQTQTKQKITNKKNKKESSGGTDGVRLPILILCGLMITYDVLYLSIVLGQYALFVGGAIVGGLWGEIWKECFRKGSSLKKLYSLSYLPYILIFLALCLLFYVMFTSFPLT